MAYINLAQPDKKCLVDLFNERNAQNLGFSIREDEVSFGLPEDVPADDPTGAYGTYNTRVFCQATQSSRIKGSCTLYYNRIDISQAGLEADALTITVNSDHRNHQDLAKDVNALLNIHLDDDDIQAEPLSVKSLDYGQTEVTLRLVDTDLVFKGTIPLTVFKDEPDAMKRPPVVFRSYQGVDIVNPQLDNTNAQLHEEWEEAKRLGRTSIYLRSLKPFEEDRFMLEEERRIDWQRDPLAFWYRLYPDSIPDKADLGQ